MQLVSSPLYAPSVCFICEQRSEGQWVDTMRRFAPARMTHLDGEKYLCEQCVRQAAKLFDLVDGSDEIVTNLKHEVAEQKHKIATFQRKLRELADVEAPKRPQGRPKKVTA